MSFNTTKFTPSVSCNKNIHNIIIIIMMMITNNNNNNNKKKNKKNKKKELRKVLKGDESSRCD